MGEHETTDNVRIIDLDNLDEDLSGNELSALAHILASLGINLPPRLSAVWTDEMWHKVNTEVDRLIYMVKVGHEGLLEKGVPLHPAQDMRALAAALFSEQDDDAAMQARNCAYLATLLCRLASGQMTKLDLPETAAGEDNSADITSEGN